jgi:hypothetical protein
MKIISVLLLCFTCIFVFGQDVDYADLNNWAAHGAKRDFSDSVPHVFVKNISSDAKKCNVFFVYPTSYTDMSFYETTPNAAINDIALNAKTDKSSILYQASCFNEQAIVYAPRYKQANLAVFYKPNTNNAAVLEVAYNDVKNAFQYFLKNINNEKPFIIASHSQGTVHAVKLIKEFIDGKPLQQKLIAAYLIGMPVKKKEFSHCAPCASANETKCFVSWRTFLHGEEGPAYLRLEQPKSILVTNPINWKPNYDAVTIVQQKAIVKSFLKPLVYDASVQAHENILWLTKPNFKGSFLLRKKKLKNLHAGDINLFYQSIRQNVVDRINAFIE